MTRIPRLRALACAALALLGAGCAPAGIVYATGQGSQTSDGLQRIQWSQFGAEFLRPGAKLQGYRQVLVDPLTIALAAPERLGPKTYPPVAGYLAGMERVYQESLARAFGSGRGLALVTQPGPGVLRISGHVADLLLTAPVDPVASRTTDLVSGFGELTLLLDVSDSVSHQMLVRTVDREPIAQDPVAGAVRNTPGANLAAQRELFDHQALLLRQLLEDLQGLPALPAAP